MPAHRDDKDMRRVHHRQAVTQAAHQGIKGLLRYSHRHVFPPDHVDQFLALHHLAALIEYSACSRRNCGTESGGSTSLLLTHTRRERGSRCKRPLPPGSPAANQCSSGMVASELKKDKVLDERNLHQVPI
jgi:hypothetical protein